MPISSAAEQSAPAAESSKSRTLFFPNYSWPRGFLKHRVRLSRGLIQFALLDLIRQRSEGRKRAAGEPVPDWCWRFSTKEAAAELGCSDREVRADLADAEKRGLLETRRIGQDIECRLTCSDVNAREGIRADLWDKLPSVKRGPQLVADEKPADEEEETELPAAAKSAPVTRQFKAVKAGAPAKPAKVDRFVEQVATQWDGPGEVTLEVAWKDKRLTVSGTLTPNGIKEIRKESGSVLPISAPSALAAEMRARAGLVVDPPGIRRIERALNGTIPVPFYLDTLIARGKRLKRGLEPGFAIDLAESKIAGLWREQKADFEAENRRQQEQEQRQSSRCKTCGYLAEFCECGASARP